MKFKSFVDAHGPKPDTYFMFGGIRGPKPYDFEGYADVHGPAPHLINLKGLVTSMAPNF